MLGLRTVGAFGELLRDECTDPASIVDLGQTRHIDGAGTGALVAASVLARHRRQRLVVVTADLVEREMLNYLGVSQVMPVVGSFTRGAAGAQEPLEGASR
jgi:anti-anti-sigma regulatory factor